MNNGLPIHIGAALLGHLNLQTTRGYVAVFNEDVVRGPGGDDPAVGERPALDLPVAGAGVGGVDQLVAGGWRFHTWRPV